MDKVGVDDAGGVLGGFIEDNGIEVLNIAGSKASKYSEIYSNTFDVVEKTILKSQ